MLLIIVGSSRVKDPGLSVYYEERRHRRSRSSPRWNAVLRIVLQELVECQCDHEILLDPFFLHFSGRLEKCLLHPGFDCRQSNILYLDSALCLTDLSRFLA